MNRNCGDCTLCCRLLPVRELGKGANTRCQHQRLHGCAVYGRFDKGFPRACAVWNCRWLVSDVPRDLARPDRSHYVVDIMPDVVSFQEGSRPPQHVEAIQIWVDPKHPEAWKDDALLAYLDAQGHEGRCAIIRFDASDGFVLFPPAMTTDGQWHERRGTVTAQHSPEELFLRLAQAGKVKVKA